MVLASVGLPGLFDVRVHFLPAPIMHPVRSPFGVRPGRVPSASTRIGQACVVAPNRQATHLLAGPHGLYATGEQLAALADSDIAVCPTLGGVTAAMFAYAPPHVKQLLADAGVTPEEVIEKRTLAACRPSSPRPATRPAAIGLGQSKGRLRRGYNADILVVGGDLAADLNALRDVRQVVLRGMPVPRLGPS